MPPDEAWQDLHTLITTQPLAVLSTEVDGHPYASLLAFASTPDLKRLLFATTRATRKYRNLERNPRVALLIDNRDNTPADFHAAMAATALGAATECAGDGSDDMRALFLSRHPHLSDFVGAPTCALLQVEVEHYYLVRRFQQVLELTP